MDGESDNASVSENGIGKQATRFSAILGLGCACKSLFWSVKHGRGLAAFDTPGLQTRGLEAGNDCF